MTAKVNVLLVDDQPGKLMSHEVMLEELGENIIKASWEALSDSIVYALLDGRA